MKLRVAHYSGNYYTLKVSCGWFGYEKDYPTATLFFESKDIVELRPKLMFFDQAKRLAESLTEKEYKEYVSNLKKKIEARHKEIDQINARRKNATFEVRK